MAGITKNPIRASEALQDETVLEVDVGAALSGREEVEFEASIPLQATVETTFGAYERLFEDAHMSIETDIALQARRLRPVEARMMLEA